MWFLSVLHVVTIFIIIFGAGFWFRLSSACVFLKSLTPICWHHLLRRASDWCLLACLVVLRGVDRCVARYAAVVVRQLCRCCWPYHPQCHSAARSSRAVSFYLSIFFSAAAVTSRIAISSLGCIIMSSSKPVCDEQLGLKRLRFTDVTMVQEEVVERPCAGSIAELLAHPVYSMASKINALYFVAVARRRAVSTRALHWHALPVSIGVPQRLAVVCRGGLSALLVLRLICFGRERAVKRALQHATCVMSRRHFVGLKERKPTCVSTLQGHSSFVTSVAYHPSAPILATGSDDRTAKLWLLNADCSAATCVSTLQGHSDCVRSVAFHPSAPYLATGSWDTTAKLWLLNADCSTASCVSLLAGHSNKVNSVAFHPTAPYIATGSWDKTVKLWLLDGGCRSAICVSTLLGHNDAVSSVAFHPTAPYLASGSYDMTAKLWLLNAECCAASCAATLLYPRWHERRGQIHSVAFHPTAPNLAIGSCVDTAMIWR